jgi:CheY-like chemotaxis protein
MVYGLIQQHRGTIRVYSELGVGTTFKVYLPTSTAPGELPESNMETKRLQGGQETILVAEDESSVRDLTVRMLSRAGYKTLAACDGQHALQLLAENAGQIDLALLDVMMPKCGGREVYNRMKLAWPDVRALFCSGYDPETAQVGFIVDTGIRLIQKPYDPALLLQAVRETLDEGLICQPG